MSCNVQLTQRAQKDLERLSKLGQKAAIQAIMALQNDPHKGHTLKGSLKGARSLEFSLPGGACRAAYYVMGENETCLVFMVGPHEGFYAEAERRAAALSKQYQARVEAYKKKLQAKKAQKKLKS